MKKIFNILFIFSLCFALSSCGDDDFTENPLSTINSVKEFLPEGGVQKIQLSTSGASVVSDQAWCKATISGNMLTVDAQMNGDADGRTSRLSIKSGDHTTYVMVHQKGAIFWIKGVNMSSKLIILSPEGGKLEGVTINSSLPVEIKPNADWIKYTYVDGKLTITADKVTTQQLRKGTISIKSGNREEVLTVGQVPYKALLGEWNIDLIRVTSNGNVPLSGKVIVSQNIDGKSYIFSSDVMIWDFPVSYDSESCSFVLFAGIHIANEGAYAVKTAFRAVSGSVGYASNYYMYADPEFNDKLVYEFKDDNSWAEQKINAFAYGAFQDGVYKGTFAVYTDIKLSR